LTHGAAGRTTTRATFGHAGGFRHGLTYDAAGRPTTQGMAEPGQPGETFGYDAADRPVSHADAQGNGTTQRYDVASRSFADTTTYIGAAGGLASVEVTERDGLGRTRRWTETRADGMRVTHEREVDDARHTETLRRDGRTVSQRTETPGGRLASLSLAGGTDDVVVQSRDARGRPTSVAHGPLTVSLAWAPDDQPRYAHVGAPLDVTACLHYDLDRRLDVVRWVQGLGTGERCGEPPDDPCAGALAAYVAGDRDPGDGRPRVVRQCVGQSERTDTLRFDEQGRLVTWRTTGRGPLGQTDHGTAHRRTLDALHQVVRDETLLWPADEPEPPSAEALALRLRALRVLSGRPDAAPVRLVDDETGEATELAPDAAGRATRYGAHDLTRDRQGRPARDRYDAQGRRVESPAAGERLLWGDDGLVAWADVRGERVFTPPLPGLQLSRRRDGVWELALLTPPESPLAVLGTDGVTRLTALYSPTGVASEARPARDFDPYPKTWAGYLKHPGTGLYDAQARLYDPDSGLLLEPDPVRPEPDAPETWSRYGYALGDPVGGWDPDGRCAVPGAIVGGLVGGIVGYLQGGVEGALLGAASGAAAGLTCGASLLAQTAVGAAVGGLSSAVQAANRGEDPLVAALRGTATGALSGALGSTLGRGASVLADELGAGSSALGRAGLNFGGDVAGDLLVQSGLVAAGLQDEVRVGEALMAGALSTGVRTVHFATGAARHIGRAVSTAAPQTRRALANVPTQVGEALRRPGRAVGSVEKAVDEAVGVGERLGVVASKATAGDFVLGKHGLHPSPRPTGTQSHHGVMSAWMKKHFSGYDANEAPAILMPKTAHERTFGVYNRWRAQMKDSMGGKFDWSKVSEAQMRDVSESMFDAAGVPAQMRGDYWQWFERMKTALQR
jgi:RHS repeat-associated protein